MDWCRLGTAYYLDRAVLRAGEAAEVLFLRCIAYSGAEESRGLVPRYVLPMLTPTKTKARTDALLREGLLLDAGDDVQIRSWERWQESLDTEADRRRKDRERKAAVRAKLRTESADASADLSADSPQTVQPESARKEVEVEVEVEKTSSSSTRKRAAKATAVPDAFPITAAMAEWGRANAPLITDPQRETAKFLDHHRSTGKTFKDWTAAWRTWMANAQGYAEQRGGMRVVPIDQSDLPESLRFG